MINTTRRKTISLTLKYDGLHHNTFALVYFTFIFLIDTQKKVLNYIMLTQSNEFEIKPTDRKIVSTS